MRTLEVLSTTPGSAVDRRYAFHQRSCHHDRGGVGDDGVQNFDLAGALTKQVEYGDYPDWVQAYAELAAFDTDAGADEEVAKARHALTWLSSAAAVTDNEPGRYAPAGTCQDEPVARPDNYALTSRPP